MTEVWALPGYDVQSLIGYGATGEVWRARELATGQPVALKRLRADADPTAVQALRREAVLLRSLDTPYVVRLREVVDDVLVLDLAAGGSLAALLTRRGTLDPGEVVTVAGPIAQALAAAHARGLVHGDVTPANVLFTADGMPLLSDLGIARLAGDRSAVDGTAEYVDPAVAAGSTPDPAADVWALAAVCHHMLAGTPPHDGDSVDEVLDAARSSARAPLGLLAPTAPRPLVAAVEQALQADPAARPDAAEFAAAVRRSHAAAPVRLTGVPPAAPVPDVRPTHAVHPGVPAAPAAAGRHVSGRVLVGTAAVLLLGVAGTAGWLSGRDQPASPVLATVSAPPSPAAATPDWRSVLDGLDAARAAAFAAPDAGRLAEVYAPGAPGLAHDTAAIDQLLAEAQRARGVRHTVRWITQLSYDGRVARLRVVDVLAAYEVLGRGDALVTRTAARGEAAYAVELRRAAGGWRLWQVAPA